MLVITPPSQNRNAPSATAWYIFRLISSIVVRSFLSVILLCKASLDIGRPHRATAFASQKIQHFDEKVKAYCIKKTDKDAKKLLITQKNTKNLKKIQEKRTARLRPVRECKNGADEIRPRR
ncbi:MAG: hypothetical protein ACLRWQ_00625 [Flavonifractor plautii]